MIPRSGAARSSAIEQWLGCPWCHGRSLPIGHYCCAGCCLIFGSSAALRVLARIRRSQLAPTSRPR